jgi:predicted lipoprotein with Yx(FWY)xxD motif
MGKFVLLAGAACIAAAAMALPASAQRAHRSATRAKLEVRNGKLGRETVNGKGLTLYLFEKARNGTSAYCASCAKVWSLDAEEAAAEELARLRFRAAA